MELLECWCDVFRFQCWWASTELLNIFTVSSNDESTVNATCGGRSILLVNSQLLPFSADCSLLFNNNNNNNFLLSVV